VFPQAPQFAASVAGSTQAPKQSVRSPEQTQLPFSQVRLAPQAFPQLPQ
jgi:hypothetical protein